MAFKTFAPGVLTSSDVNTFLMRQAVITCTSSTRPASPSEGMTIYETDTDLYLTYSGSAWSVTVHPGEWETYTPTISGSTWTLGNGTATGRYQRVGNAVLVFVEIVWGSTSTYGGTGLRITLPATPRSTASVNPYWATCQLRDTSTSTGYSATALHFGSNLVAIFTHGVAASFATLDEITSTKPFTWANGDSISFTTIYEVA